MKPLDGYAIVYCEGAFNTPNGKTAHGLVRFTHRYKVMSVIDSHYVGKDAGTVLDGKKKGIPVFANLQDALDDAVDRNDPATHFVIGIAPDGGRLKKHDRQVVIDAMRAELDVDCGLHDFLSKDPYLKKLADDKGVTLRDIRKPKPRKELHFFSGKIEEVTSTKIAVLGTDSAIGKRTTAWLMVQAFQNAGQKAEMIGTGQTAWMQGAKYSIVMDSLVNDFVSGEIEHAVWSAWKGENPDVIVIEGQGSLMNPAYPGGFEILAAGRPDAVVLQHAPARLEYDGFPGYALHPLDKQIQAIELISGVPVVAITINHENLKKEEIPAICQKIQQDTGLPAFDVLLDGAAQLVDVLKANVK
jgi:uncharacterized NAD-dependent epimerase/dehydratase family protein